jgi:hypothetical protein
MPTESICRGGGEPRRRLLLQTAQDQRFKLHRQLGHNLAQVGRVGKLDRANGLELRRVGPVEGMASADQLIENQAEGEYIGLHAGPAGHELLRRHVRDGAAARGVGGLGWRRRAPARAGRIEVGLVQIQLARQPEVEDLDQAAVGQHHIGRLQVAMEDAQLVRRGEPVGDLDARRKRQLQARRPLGNHLVQRLARNVLHHDVSFVFAARFRRCLAHIVDGADVGVVDGRGQPRLAQLRRPHLLQRQRPALQQFQHHRPLKQCVRGQIHHARPACADLAQKLVVPDCAALHTSIIASRD